MKVKEGSEKAGLQLNIQKMNIMGSVPSLHGKYMGKQWKECQTVFFWTRKSLQMVIAAIKLRCLLLERKNMTNLDSMLKSRDVTLPTKVHLVEAMVFPVVMYGCES